MQINERSGLDKLTAYHGGLREDGILLNANENPYAMPDNVKDKVFEQLSLAQFNRYPQIDAICLRQTIADSFNLSVDNIQLGNGSSALICACCHAFGGKRRKIAYISPSFSMYETYCVLSDSTPLPFSLEDDFTIDVDKMLVFLQSQTPDILILCNPNNPTGTQYNQQDLVKIIKNANCLVLLDEAYIEFCDSSLVGQLKEHDNLAILRTFSKAYGLASARVGYILSYNKKIIEILSKVLLPFQINSMSLVTAQVVFENKSEYNKLIDKIKLQRDYLTYELTKLNCLVYPSSTNFILFSLGKTPQDNANLSEFLSINKVFVRDFSSSCVLKNAVRLTVGTKQENELVVALIERFLKGRG